MMGMRVQGGAHCAVLAVYAGWVLIIRRGRVTWPSGQQRGRSVVIVLCRACRHLIYTNMIWFPAHQEP